MARGHQDRVLGIRFDGAEEAAPGPGVLEALSGAQAILIAPSNPLISIAPILAVQGIREALASALGPVRRGQPDRRRRGAARAGRRHAASAWATSPRRSGSPGSTQG